MRLTATVTTEGFTCLSTTEAQVPVGMFMVAKVDKAWRIRDVILYTDNQSLAWQITRKIGSKSVELFQKTEMGCKWIPTKT